MISEDPDRRRETRWEQRRRADDARRDSHGFVDALLKRLDDWTWTLTADWEPSHKQDVKDAIELLETARRCGALTDPDS